MVKTLDVDDVGSITLTVIEGNEAATEYKVHPARVDLAVYIGSDQSNDICLPNSLVTA